jgi:Domain of unknown function (DUF4279)
MTPERASGSLYAFRVTDDDDVLAREAVARLTIYSETCSAGELVSRVGHEPDEKWNKGDQNKRGRPIGTTAISYRSSLRDDAAPAEHLADLVARVEPFAQRLDAEREAGSSVRLKLALFDDTDNVMFSFPADLLTRVASLGVETEFDIYLL